MPYIPAIITYYGFFLRFISFPLYLRDKYKSTMTLGNPKLYSIYSARPDPFLSPLGFYLIISTL